MDTMLFILAALVVFVLSAMSPLLYAIFRNNPVRISLHVGPRSRRR